MSCQAAGLGTQGAMNCLAAHSGRGGAMPCLAAPFAALTTKTVGVTHLEVFVSYNDIRHNTVICIMRAAYSSKTTAEVRGCTGRATG